MIQITIGTNTQRKQVTASPDTTLRDLLEQNDINYSTTQLHLDGAPLQAGDLDKTFEDFGIKEKCHLISVVKADNANLYII